MGRQATHPATPIGEIGARLGSGTPAERAVLFLGQLEPVLPGISLRWNGRATIDYWTGYEWTKESYSYWKVGQYTKFAGAERQQEGACHFAGEHTSVDFQGYLNGAVESGRTSSRRDPGGAYVGTPPVPRSNKAIRPFEQKRGSIQDIWVLAVPVSCG